MGCSRPLLVCKGDSGAMTLYELVTCVFCLGGIQGFVLRLRGGGGCNEGGELGLSLSRGSVAALVFRTLRWPVLLGVKEGRTIKPTDGLEWRLCESG